MAPCRFRARRVEKIRAARTARARLIQRIRQPPWLYPQPATRRQKAEANEDAARSSSRCADTPSSVNSQPNPAQLTATVSANTTRNGCFTVLCRSRWRAANAPGHPPATASRCRSVSGTRQPSRRAAALSTAYVRKVTSAMTAYAAQIHDETRPIPALTTRTTRKSNGTSNATVLLAERGGPGDRRLGRATACPSVRSMFLRWRWDPGSALPARAGRCGAPARLTRNGRPRRLCPSRALIAVVACVGTGMVANPKPLGRPSSSTGKWTRCTRPYGANSAASSSAGASYGMLPMKMSICGGDQITRPSGLQRNPIAAGSVTIRRCIVGHSFACRWRFTHSTRW